MMGPGTKSSERPSEHCLLVLLLLLVPTLAARDAKAAATAETPLAEATRLRAEQLATSNVRAAALYREAADLLRAAGKFNEAAAALRNGSMPLAIG